MIESDVPNTTHLDEMRDALAEHTDKAPDFLKDPALLHRVKTEYLDKDITGEDTNKLLIFTILATSLTNTPLGVIVTGESSTGKSYLVGQITKHFPNVIEYTRVTRAAPDRSQQDFSHKIMYIGELFGVEAAQSSLRILISEGKLKLWTTARDDEGHITTEELETKGVPVFVTTTTNIKPDAELLNRLFIVSTDDSETQTKRILAFEAQNFMCGDQPKSETEQPKLADYLSVCLNSEGTNGCYRVPYSDVLAKMFPTTTWKARRDFKKLLILIGAIATLHIYQRQVVYSQCDENKRYVIAEPADLYLALRVCDKSLRQTLLSMQDRMLRTLALFTEDVELSANQIAALTGFSANRSRELLNELVNAGYLSKNDEKKTHIYSLTHTTPTELITIEHFKHLYESWGETELNLYLEQEGFISLLTRNTTSCEVVDPITGVKRDLSGMLNDLRPECIMAQPKTEQAPTLKSKTLAKYNTGESIATSPSDSALLPTVIIKMRELCPTPFPKDVFIQSLMLEGYDEQEADKHFDQLVKHSLIYRVDEMYYWS